MTSNNNWFYSLKGERVIPRVKGAAFITIEGSDGSGKTTQGNILEDYFRSRGHKVILTKEPDYQTSSGEKIRQILYGELPMPDPKSFQKLYTENRKEHVDNIIIPALKEGQIVIADRYYYATFAHALLDAHNIEDLIQLNYNFVAPDLAITILAKPETCIKRLMEKNRKLDFFETVDKIRKIDKNYRDLADRFKNMAIIDGEKSVREVTEQSIKLIEGVINL